MMVLARLPATLVLAACGAAPPQGSAADRSAQERAATATPAPAESEECRAERLAILDAVAESQAKPCAADTECATATNPGSFVKEFDVVVNAADRDVVNARSRAHLDRCGAFYYYEPIDAIRVVEARCVDGRCAEDETVLHVEE